jgi:phosphohistidine phosphatase
LSGEEQNWAVRKGAVWWLTTREREGRAQVVLRSVTNPEQL